MKKTILIIVFSFGGLLSGELGKLKPRVVFCDVGQGDGSLIIDGSFQMMLDTGPKNLKMVNCLNKQLPFWDRKIEVVIISHDDVDHLGGLELVSRYYNVQKNYSEKINKNDIFRYGKIEYEILSAEKNKEIVGVLRYDSKRILFLSDNGMETEEKLSLEKMTGVRLGHHGSKNATSEKMLEITKPDWVVISVGKNNRYGHPHQETLEKLKDIKMLRTDLEGTVSYDLTRNSLIDSRGDLFNHWNQLIKVFSSSHNAK